MKKNSRATNAAYILFGLIAIAVSALRLLNPVDYPPGDVRSEDWFYPVSGAVGALLGVFFVVVGAVRLVLGR